LGVDKFRNDVLSNKLAYEKLWALYFTVHYGKKGILQ
jgi:hypothetical protein